MFVVLVGGVEESQEQQGKDGAAEHVDVVVVEGDRDGVMAVV